MNNPIKKRQNKKLNCPHCGQIFQRAQGLAGHIRYKHAAVVSKAAQPTAKKNGNAVPALEPVAPLLGPGESPSETKSVPTTASVSAAQGVPNNGAHEHLKTALEALSQRQQQIDAKLTRMEALQSEKEMIRKQLDAVNTALQAFGG